MDAKHETTLKRVLARPTPPDLDWDDIESMLRAIGVRVLDRSDSRVALVSGGEVMVVFRPHSKPLAVRATVRDVAAFIKVVGVDS